MTSLTATESTALLDGSREKTYRAHSRILDFLDPGNHVLVIKDGWVKVVAIAPNGEESLLAIRGPGDVIGEISAVDGLPRSAAIIALVEVRAHIISGEIFLRRVINSPPLSLALLRHFAAHLRESDVRRIEYVSSDTFGRLVVHIVDLGRQHGSITPNGEIELKLPLSQGDLAAKAAMSREAVARGLRSLRERSLIRTERLRITIVRPDLLRAIARSVHHDT